MQRKWFIPILAAMTAVLAAGFIACGDDDDDSAEDAETDVCSSLDDLATAIEGVQDLTVDSTVDEAQDAVDAVESAWQDVVSSGADLEQARADELDAAIADVQDTIGNASGEDTIGEAVNDIQSSIESAEAARAEIGSGLDCS